jgi:DNA-directed RNA polymerase alpha subunit
VQGEKEQQIMKSSQSDPQDGDLPPGLAQPALRALAGAGIQRLAQLCKYSEAEIKRLHGIGPNALARLRQALSDKGLSFAGEKGEKK